MTSTSRPRLVIDASVALHLATANAPLKDLDRYVLSAPCLMWSEATSVLRERAYRREIAEHAAREAIARLDALPVEADQRPQIRRRAFDVAIDLGWARTDDAEYVALAELLEAPLLTVDERLRRGASRRVRCLAPADL